MFSRGVRAILARLQQLEASINERTQTIMTTVAEVQAAVTQLTTDIEADIAAVNTEFARLEQQVSEGVSPDLEPLKVAVESLDQKVKSAEGEVPTE